MGTKLGAHEIELRMFRKATLDAKIAAEHNSHGDVIIDATYQQELDIRNIEYRELMDTTKAFYKTLYEKEHAIYKANNSCPRSALRMAKHSTRTAIMIDLLLMILMLNLRKLKAESNRHLHP